MTAGASRCPRCGAKFGFFTDAGVCFEECIPCGYRRRVTPAVRPPFTPPPKKGRRLPGDVADPEDTE